MTDKEMRPIKKDALKEGAANLCPFLGFVDDPETAISYPSRMNCCNHARPVVTVAMDYQREMCLTGMFP